MLPSPADVERTVSWLQSIRFCAGLDAEQIQAIAGRMKIRPFVAGETLGSAGDYVTEFWIVAEGELETFLTDARGRERLIGTVNAGETVGELAILERAPSRPIRFTARSHGTLLVAPASSLHDWVQAYPQIMQNV